MAVDSRNVALNIKQLMRFYGSLVANNNGTPWQTDGLRGGWATMGATCTLSHKIKDNHYFSKIAHKSLACSLYRSPRKCIKIRYVCARVREGEGEREYLFLCVGNAPANGNSRNRNKVYVTLRIRSVAYEYMHARMQRLS